MKGVVVCPQPRAAEEGSNILARGGNAVDAAVATAFVQAVLSPCMCGVGGFGTMLVYRARTGEKVCIDFHGRAGSKVTPEMWQDRIISLSSDTPLLRGNPNIVGLTAVTVPGTVKGLHTALTGYGTMSWREVIEPAIPYAEEGAPLTTGQASFYTAGGGDPGFPAISEVLKATPGCERIWWKEDGSRYQVGELRPNKDYGRTLRRLIDEGPDSLYSGSIAREIIRDIERNGGFVTADDLRDYEPRLYAPLEGSYRGYQIFTNRPPGGGTVLLEFLNILENYPLDEMHPDALEYVWLEIQALRAAHSDRVQYLGDEEFVSVPVEMLASKERADYWRKKIDSEERIVVPRKQLMPNHTTHISAVDEEGNAVSVTHTNCTYSGCATLGLGFIYNNSMVQFHAMPGLPNSIAPGKAPITGPSPTMVFKEGKLVMVNGAHGGFRIPGGIAQSIINVVDHGMSMQEAVNAPRVHSEGGVIELEGRIRADVAAGLRHKGNPVYHWPDGFAGRASAGLVAIMIDPVSGEWKIGPDPRGGGGFAYSHG